MKTIITLITTLILVPQLMISQAKKSPTKKDSIFVFYQRDEMEDKTYYFPSGKIAVVGQTQGFSVSAFIEPDLTITDLDVKMVGIGSCVENNEIIFLFEDATKIKLTSWNDFNCEGKAWFKVEESDIEQLSTKRISKIKVTNGRTYDSYTGEVDESRRSYFIELFIALKNKKIKELKK